MSGSVMPLTPGAKHASLYSLLKINVAMATIKIFTV